MSRFEAIPARRLQFVGEQDGPPERGLKERLSVEFAQIEPIQRAYLARARYEENGPITVILGVRAETKSKEELARRIGRIFASGFRSDVHLDILFLSDAQESELAEVCKAFYSRTPVRRRWYWPFGARGIG